MPFFAGTGYRPGDAVADVIGYEWDNTHPEREPGDTEDEASTANPAGDVRVVLRGEALDYRGRERVAEAIYFESPAGARVFSAGTIRWSWGLGKPGFEQARFLQLNRNLVLWFLGREIAPP